MTLGLGLQIDNDLACRSVAEELSDLARHRQRAELGDRLGFRALWLRDVTQRLPRDFGGAPGPVS